MKKCCTCKVEYPLTEFGANKSREDGLQKECKNCRKEMHKESYLRRQKALRKGGAPDPDEYLAGVAMVRGCGVCGMGIHECLDFYKVDTSLRGKLRPFRPRTLSVAKALADEMVVVCKNCAARIDAGNLTCEGLR
jgi:hypothetical protein